MSRGLALSVRDNLEKCRSSAIAAVDAYNQPGPRFRTAQYVVLIIMAWTALFHAVFYRSGRRPWFRKATTGAGVRYVKVDGDPKHWDLSECLKQFYGDKHPAERKNLEFLVGLRNKIEHRHLPELDPALYGECQAALLNLEEMMVGEFGQKYAMVEQLAVSLQFSQLVPEEKRKATKALITRAAKSVRDYVEKFRGSLASSVLGSMKYSFSVFLVPKVGNRASASDMAVEFLKVDEASEEELKRLEKLNVLIKEKHVPIANLGLFKPSEVVREVRKLTTVSVDLHVHTCAWRHYKVRPAKGDPHPERTRSEYCVYDETHEDYVYTKAWIEKLAASLTDTAERDRVLGHGSKAPSLGA
jgi:hypothetical protein